MNPLYIDGWVARWECCRGVVVCGAVRECVEEACGGALVVWGQAII